MLVVKEKNLKDPWEVIQKIISDEKKMKGALKKRRDSDKSFVEISDDVKTVSLTKKGSHHDENQDNTLVYRNDHVEIIAVADGHGHREYHPRSAIGSRFACECAIEVLKDIAMLVESGDLSFENEKKYVLYIKNVILKKWHKRVERDILHRPFTDEEIPIIYKERESFLCSRETHRLYGTTLLAVMIIHDYGMLAFQIGDGKITVMDQHGNIRTAIPEEKQDSLFKSSSISQRSQELSNRYIWFSFNEYPVLLPAFVVLTTDGVENTLAKDYVLLNTMIKKMSLELIDDTNDDPSVQYYFENIIADNTDDATFSGFFDLALLSILKKQITDEIIEAEGKAKKKRIENRYVSFKKKEIFCEKQMDRIKQLLNELDLKLNRSEKEKMNRCFMHYRNRLRKLEQEKKTMLEEIGEGEFENLEKKFNNYLKQLFR